MNYVEDFESQDDQYEDIDEDIDEDFDEDVAFYSEQSKPRRRYQNRRPVTVAKRPPLSAPQAQTAPDGGVSKATLNTPKGSADIALPAPVPTRAEFTAAVDKLNEAIKTQTARLNTLQQDITKVGSSVSSLTKGVNALAKETRENHARLEKQQKESEARQRKALKKMRQEQSSQAMNSMMLSLLMTQQSQTKFDNHTHTGVATGTGETGKPKSSGTGTDNMALLLPLMLMGQGQSNGNDNDGGSGGGMNNMMMPLMMMTMMK
jgi:regulator of replication initiation timing